MARYCKILSSGASTFTVRIFSFSPRFKASVLCPATFFTGSKLAVVDETGKVLDTKVIFPTAPQNKVEEAKTELKKLIKKYHITLISVGNGTASRESEQVIVELLKELDTPVQYVFVNEVRSLRISLSMAGAISLA